MKPKQYILVLHFLGVPCSAVMKNTKYKISNITKSLILASSPFIGRDFLPVEYGSPAFSEREIYSPENVKYAKSDNTMEQSQIQEIRVPPPLPLLDETNRNGKSLEDRRKL